MSGELEAAGALATAGLAAGAIEGREAGDHGDGKCANCGAELQGAYCHACGQAGHPHRSLLHMFEEFLHGILHFDTKAWRTLPMLAFRPGTLTRNYVYGKRARYISPLALFLFTIFFMFAVFAFSGNSGEVPGLEITERASLEEAQASIAESRRELAREEAELQAALANPDPNQPAGLEERLARMEVRLAEESLRRDEATLTRVERALAAASAAQSGEGEDPARAQEGEPAQTVEDGVVTSDITNEGTWQEQLATAARRDDFNVTPFWPWLNDKIKHKLQNPDLALYSIRNAAYKFSFLLIPISLPFIALLFLWKRGVTFYDHVVFALYGLSFASILFVILVWGTSIASSLSWAWAAIVSNLVLFVGMPVHMYFHLKGAYALGWWSALWRTFFMLWFSLACLVIFIFAIVVLGLVG